jgi:hypothetical protein
VEYIPQLGAITQAGMTIRQGKAIPSSEAGLGIAWDWDKIGHLRVEGTTYVID